MEILLELKEKCKGLSVLYVEDELELLRATSEFLEKLFGLVVCAKDGVEGLEKLEGAHFDLVITDINMPRLNGLDMIERMREKDYKTRVMLATAYGDDRYLLRAINLSVDGYIKKPLEFDGMMRVLSKIVNNIHNEKLVEKQAFDAQMVSFTQERFKSMNKLMNNIAHHWRQPLSLIMLETDNISEELQECNKEKIEVSCKKINGEVKCLSQTISQFSELVHSKKVPTLFNLRSVFDYLVKISGEMFTATGIRVEIECDDGLMVETHERELKNVLFGLLANAKESLEKKKRLDVGFDGVIWLFAAVENEKVVIKIKDNGVGVDHDTRAEIFDPYFTTKFPSRGVGLSLCLFKMSVENELLGTIILNHDYTDGAEFILEVPLKLVGDAGEA